MAGLGLAGVPAEVLFALAFNDVYSEGNVRFHELFGVHAGKATCR